MDREKVINELNTDVLPFLQHHCDMQCGREKRWISKMIITVHDALALLKEKKEYCDKCAESAIKTTVELQEEIARLRSLLKEQDAVEPSFKQGKDGIFVWCCGSCGAYMYHIYDGIDKAKEYAKYCRQCGKKVKWE